MDIMIWVSMATLIIGYVLGVYVGKNIKKFIGE